MLTRTATVLIVFTNPLISGFLKKNDADTKQCEKDGTCDKKKSTTAVDFWTKKDKKYDNSINLKYATYVHQEDQYQGRAEKEILTRLNSSRRVIDEACSELSGICYQVVDYMWNDVEGYGMNTWEMVRKIQVKGDSASHFGRTLLVTPPKLTWKNFDTKHWQVNDFAVIDREVQALMGSLFGSDAIPKEEKNVTRRYSVLLVGLGNGIIPVFLKQFHWIDLTVVEEDPLIVSFAKKWFSVEEGPTMNIIIDEGVRFLMQAGKKGYEYDGLIINACSPTSKELICPRPEYLERSTIESYRKILRQSGVLAVNSRATTKQLERAVVGLHSGVFPVCFDYPEDFWALQVDRHISTVCYNRDAPSIWTDSLIRTHYIAKSSCNWFFHI